MRALVSLRLAIAAGLALCCACRVTPTYVLDLMDARSDEEAFVHAREAAELLGDRSRRLEVRLAAAKVLGRLEDAGDPARGALAGVLLDRGEHEDLRAFSAWALGEMRSRPSLELLTRALASGLPVRVSERALEGIAKHLALLLEDEEALLDLAEAMITYAKDEPRVSPIYDVVSDETRTVAVNIRLLDRTLDRASKDPSPERAAAAYGAALELFFGLEAVEREIAAGPATWDARVTEAVRAGRRALEAGDEPTALLVLWYLGRLSRLREIGSKAAPALAEPVAIARAAVPLRLVRVWALSRLEILDVSARNALRRDVLAREIDAEVLRLVADVSARPGEHDLLQKMLGAE